MRLGIRTYSVILGCMLCGISLSAQETTSPEQKKSSLVHPAVGASFSCDDLKMTFIARHQNFSRSLPGERDTDVRSPKSVNIHPSGKKYYVNSLEGSKTIVYDMKSHEKLKVIVHKFNDSHADLWAPESGLFKFNHSYSHPNTFDGKPVESAFSHGGRYLWVPYYRRSFDLNAQDPSAVAVIDTRSDEIVRLFETGALPKMIALSPDGTKMAISHWGENTVGVLDISSSSIEDWKYINCYVVDYKLKLDFSLTSKVDRDSNSGYSLRGTVFTPDSRYLLVGCMGGKGGIAVIDLQKDVYLGRILGMKSNLRHILISNGHVYCSINASGFVQRTKLSNILEAIKGFDGAVKTVKMTDWESCKTPAGARTISISPDGRYVFAACNFGSCVAVVRTSDMKLLGSLSADSFPVGMDISDDGRYLLTTSQGHPGTGGGNAVDIFEIEYK